MIIATGVLCRRRGVLKFKGNMTRKKLPSIQKKDSPKVMIRVSEEEYNKIVKARGDLGKPISTMMKTAFFEFYLPYEYEQIGKQP